MFFVCPWDLFSQRMAVSFYSDGLYVLLRPAKKRKQGTEEQPKVPPHLRHLVMKEDLSEVCPWSLSGPQFPQPTAIQQRYCYPKGRAEYSKQKGGALWTMYATDGKEDVEYRLLHVYYSAKRATNKRISIPDDEKSINSPIYAQAPKRQKVARLPSSASMHANEYSLSIGHGHGFRHHYAHPAAPSTYSPLPGPGASSTIDAAPIFENLAPPSPVLSFHDSNLVTPNGNSSLQYTGPRPVEDRWIHADPNSDRRPIESLSFTHSPLRCSRSTLNQNNEVSGNFFSDSLSLDLSASWQDIDCNWEDPFMNIKNHPSNDSSASDNGIERSDSESLKSEFSYRLQLLKQALHDNIIIASVDDQDELLQMLGDWGQTIASSIDIELPFPPQSNHTADDEGIHDFLNGDESHPVQFQSIFSEAV